MPIPVPTVMVYDLNSRVTTMMPIESDTYVANVMWANSSTIAAVTLNRLQNTKTMRMGVVSYATNGIIPFMSYILRVSSAWVQNVCVALLSDV